MLQKLNQSSANPLHLFRRQADAGVMQALGQLGRNRLSRYAQVGHQGSRLGYQTLCKIFAAFVAPQNVVPGVCQATPHACLKQR